MQLWKWLRLLLTIGGVLLLDQLAKNWVIANMVLGESRELHPALLPFLQLTYIENTGVAFGLGSGNSGLFLLLAMAISVVLFVLYLRAGREAVLYQIGLAIVLGGALGNVMDRIRLGYVVDFVHIRIPPLGISNVSNFADHAVVIGVIVLLMDSFLQERRANRALDSAQNTSTHSVLGDEPPTQ